LRRPAVTLKRSYVFFALEVGNRYGQRPGDDQPAGDDQPVGAENLGHEPLIPFSQPADTLIDAPHTARRATDFPAN
jgi:hypothetical protein